jgi:raffinose/stachyose/melibiose transport system permease protein
MQVVPSSDRRGSTGSQAAPSARPSRRSRSQLRTAALMLPPALLLFTMFVVLPIGEAAWYSFFSWDGYGRPTDWVGLRNFEDVLGSRVFRTALGNNLLTIATSLLVQLPVALGLALILAERIPGAAIFRLVFFLPYVMAEIAAGLIWRFVYDGDYGLVAELARAIGVTDPPHLLADPATAEYAILSVVVWKYFGFHMMLFIAGLQAIDRDLYAAARVDGATGWQVFRHVQLPLLMPTVKLSVFFAILGSLQLFDLVMPLTKGGPSDSSQTLVSFLYSHGITRMRVGYGSAIGVILFVLCVAFAIFYKRRFMRDER